MKKLILIILLLFNSLLAQQKILLDDFENISGWNLIKSEGAEISISQDVGLKGRSIRVDYNFKYGTGYCGIQKLLKIKLPENYRFDFFIRATSPNNNFEIKFLDSTRENVWWFNNRNFEFPKNWQKFSVKKRNIQFAWGPTQDKSFSEFSYLEFTISSFTGGNGTIWLDELTFEEIKDTLPLEIKISPKTLYNLIDGNEKTKVTSNKTKFSFTISFNKNYELGGLKILWDDNFPKTLTISQSDDSLNWTQLVSIKKISKKVSILQFKFLETRFLKFEITSKRRIIINEIVFFDHQFSESKNNIFFELSKSDFSDLLPEYFNGKASYWTIVGVESDEKEALINSNGMIEVDKNKFSILPFLEVNNAIKSFNDFDVEQYLAEDYLPLPIVEWNDANMKLVIKTFASGIPNKSTKLFIEYILIKKSKQKTKGKLYLSILPFQVNPYYQFLNNPGGVSEVEKIKVNKGNLKVDGSNLYFSPEAKEIKSFNFIENDAISAVKEKNFYGSIEIKDEYKLGSALLSFPFDFSKKDTFVFRLVYDYYSTFSEIKDNSSFVQYFSQEENKVKNFWRSTLNKTEISGSDKIDRLFKIIKANLAYILINKDNSAIQPGSRSYERSWIRDGSLTSTALLRFGFNYEVKDFIRWFGKHIYENGKVPCVVDKRGPDPVDEHDSHGEFLYLLNTYFKFSKDTSFLRENFNLVKRIVHFIDSLTSTRKSQEYQSDSLRAFYGLMPQSISHEGYSAKPMHSYWDDFFTICGLDNATEMALTLGEKDSYNYFKNLRDEFQINLINSISHSIKNHNIDYIPGCVELGDFDPTSTSIAFFPCEQDKFLPQYELKNTFEKYYRFIKNRKEKNDFENFTPYELRNINAFVFLDEKERAIELIDFMLNYQRPSNWLHWAEVVWRDSIKPAFIGDMPHTWVGSDFINAFYNMFVYESNHDSTIKLLNGFDESFLDSKNHFEINNLITQKGNLNLILNKINNDKFEVILTGNLDLNGWSLELNNFTTKEISEIKLNNKDYSYVKNNKIIFNQFPAKLTLTFNEK